MGPSRVEEVKGGYVGRPMPGPHSDSVKRHLDVYDVETSLNEVRISFVVCLYFFSFFYAVDTALSDYHLSIREL